MMCRLQMKIRSEFWQNSQLLLQNVHSQHGCSVGVRTVPDEGNLKNKNNLQKNKITCHMACRRWIG
ncbi:hypothetical protein TYRP_004335 [Tyrophagus putrescentiae]|nr:hypothetical protein TYRP_004335 [Tyrophagus putrescentiae]